MNPAETSRPPLDRAALAQPPHPWVEVEVLDAAESTNAVLADRFRAGAAEGLVVVAEHQTAGRGRLDRAWETPPFAALTFSVLLTPDRVPAERWPWLPLLAGVSVVKGVSRATGVDCHLKWPNDILAGGQKLGGILVERVTGPAGPAAVVGVGINVSTTREELPIAEATSLALLGAAGADRTALLSAVLVELADGYAEWVRCGGDPAGGLLAEYVARCDTVGREVRVELPGAAAFTGRAVGVDESGALKVDTGAAHRLVSAGDVIHLHPA